MSRIFRVAAGATLVVAGGAAAAAWLAPQGLDRAARWVSVFGVFASLCLGVTGLVLGRRNKVGGVTVERTGKATAVGRGSRANTGSITGGDHHVSDTGDAEARTGGHANTGIDDRRPGR